MTTYKVFSFPTYFTVAILLGAMLIIEYLLVLPNKALSSDFIFLLLLAPIAAAVSPTIKIDQSEIPFEVEATVALASLVLLGPEMAVLVIVVGRISGWLTRPKHNISWKESLAQLGFGTGTHAISIFASGGVYFLLKAQFAGLESSIFYVLLFPVSFFYFYFNLAVLIGRDKLRNDLAFSTREAWESHNWAAQVNAVVSAFGGCLLVYVITNFNWPFFFLPIVFSRYAFELYIKQLKSLLFGLEKLVEARTQKLAALDQQKNAFLGVLTHDMLTPLASISLFTEIIREEPDSIKEDPGLIETLFHSQKTLMNLVQNILDLDKRESGKPLESKKRQANLTQILQDVLITVKIAAVRKKILISYKPSESPIWILGDIAQLERVFLNLLSNAVKYTPRYGKISVTSTLDKFIASVEIRDTGYGIPAEDLPRIFDAYRRSQAHANTNGNGLGLAIAQALLAEHKGKIRAESTENSGTTFYVSLPVSH